MIKKWLADGFELRVRIVEFDKETPCYLWRNNYRTPKDGHMLSYFDSFKEAKENLIELTRSDVVRAQYVLDMNNKKHIYAKGLKDDTKV